MGSHPSVIPDGAITADDYARRYRISNTTARNQLEQMISDGKMKKIHVHATFFVPTGKIDSCPPCPPSQNGKTKKSKR